MLLLPAQILLIIDVWPEISEKDQREITAASARAVSRAHNKSIFIVLRAF